MRHVLGTQADVDTLVHLVQGAPVELVTRADGQAHLDRGRAPVHNVVWGRAGRGGDTLADGTLLDQASCRGSAGEWEEAHCLVELAIRGLFEDGCPWRLSTY